jgi:hypothetical protein
MLDDVLQNAMSAIPNCIALGAVDLTTGVLLAMQSQEERSQEMLNVVTTTITELFEAPLLQAFSEVYAPEADAGGSRDAIHRASASQRPSQLPLASRPSAPRTCGDRHYREGHARRPSDDESDSLHGGHRGSPVIAFRAG